MALLDEHGRDAPLPVLREKDDICFIYFFIGVPERYVKEALERGKSLHSGPVIGSWRWVRFPGTLRESKI